MLADSNLEAPNTLGCRLLRTLCLCLCLARRARRRLLEGAERGCTFGVSSRLRDALKRDGVFSKEKVRTFGLKNLRGDSFVNVDGVYYEPVS